ncbi:MAG TPA: phospholipase D-like domain-containing protein [Chthoniobacterales bacterium]|nr:phospholipase D-like domain-containing protein [Chthoniobacterales bacterium]
MATTRKRRRASQFLGRQYGRLSLGDWSAITLAFLGIVLIFCLFFIRRQTLDYKLEHSFAIRAPEFFSSALALGNPVPVEGNKVELLNNGDEYFPAMLEAIRSAERTINFAAYILQSDNVGRQFRDAFCERARAGVEVRILLDGIGSGWELDNSDVRMMKEAGCKFDYYHPVGSWRMDRTNRRSHRRILVIDGKIGFTGGAAFADKWSGHAQDPNHWRDVQVRVEGPVVAAMQAAFQSHWVKTFDEALTGADQFPPLAPAGAMRAQIVESRSFSSAPVAMVQAVTFAAAEQRIWITNPYCTPSDNQVELLVQAASRGVDVRFLLPGPHNDQPLTESAGRTAYGKLLEGGVKIFEYQPTMIHSKTMVADGIFSMVGSSNLDARSSEINEELDLVIYDEGFARQMEETFERDLAQSREYTLEEFRKRSWWERFTEWLAIPFRSQL